MSSVMFGVNNRSGASSLPPEKAEDLLEVEATLQYKLRKAMTVSSDDDFESMSDEYQPPSPNYKRLAVVAAELDQDQVVEKANKAYHWFITPGKKSEKQYFLVTDRLLGQGAQAEVYHGFTSHGAPCAVKRGKVKKKEVQHLQELSKVPSEKSNVNRLITADQEQGIVVMELAHSTLSEAHALVPEKKLSPEGINILIRGILSGLREIAHQEIVHSDIKPENIFVIQKEGYLAAKIGDFGLSIRVGDRFIGGTRHFYAPELFYYFDGEIDLSYDEQLCKLDMWSAMLVFGEFANDLLSQAFCNRLKAYMRKIKSGIRLAQQAPIGQKPPTKKESKYILSHYMVQYFNQMLDKRDGLFSDLEPQTHLDRLMQQMAIIYPMERISADEALQLFDGLRPTRSPGLEMAPFEEEIDG